MTDKAQLKRLTDLFRTTAGLPTDRTAAEILAAEKAAAAQYIAKSKPAVPATEASSEQSGQP